MDVASLNLSEILSFRQKHVNTLSPHNKIHKHL